MQSAFCLIVLCLIFAQETSVTPEADYTLPFTNLPRGATFSIDPISRAQTAEGIRSSDLTVEVRAIKRPGTNVVTLRVLNRSKEPIAFPLLRDGRKVYGACKEIPIIEAAYFLDRTGDEPARATAGPEFFGCTQLPGSFVTLSPGGWADIVNLPLEVLQFPKRDSGELTLLISTHTYSGLSNALHDHVKQIASGSVRIPLE